MSRGPNVITRALESREPSVAGRAQMLQKGERFQAGEGFDEPSLVLKYRDPLVAQRPEGGLWELRATSS